MASLSRRISSFVLATAMVGALADPVLAQVSPAAPTVGPSGGTPSTTAPSNSEGTPSGGTGIIGQSRVGPGAPSAGGGYNDGRIVLNPQQNASEDRPATRRHSVRPHQRAQRHQARRAPGGAAGVNTGAGTGAGPSSGLNGSNAISK